MVTRAIRRRALSLIELMVVVAIISILVGLLFPAVQKIRESARQTVSRNNLRQMALGAINFQSVTNVYPAQFTQSSFNSILQPSHPGYGGYTGGTFFSLLPYIGEDNTYQAAGGAPGYLTFNSPDGSIPPSSGFGFNPNPCGCACGWWCNCDCGSFNSQLPTSLFQSWRVPPVLTKTFVAPSDPSIPSNINLTMTNDIVANPVSYLWNMCPFPMLSPEDCQNGTTHTLLVIEGYAFCGSFTPPAGASSSTIRAGWNLDFNFLDSWSSYPLTNSAYQPIYNYLPPGFWPTQPVELWDIKPEVWNCNVNLPQSFVNSGAIQLALYDGSVKTISPSQEISTTDDILGYLALNNPGYPVPPEVDW